VDSKTPGFDDPQCTFRRAGIEQADEFAHAIEKGGVSGSTPDRKDHYAGAGSRRVAEHLAEITAQCDERSAFVLAHLKQCLVRHPTQP
jgi:hypothetical protein